MHPTPIHPEPFRTLRSAVLGQLMLLEFAALHDLPEPSFLYAEPDCSVTAVIPAGIERWAEALEAAVSQVEDVRDHRNATLTVKADLYEVPVTLRQHQRMELHA